MALWDNLGKKASETTAKAVQQARVLSETSRLNGLISDEEKKINNNYYQIGKLYVAMHQNDYEDEFAGMIAAASESERKIKAYRMQIQDFKGVVHCEKCGAEVPKGVAFCSSCGSAMPKVESMDVNKYEKCAHCGEIVEKGMRFCTSCGKSMVAVSSIPSTPAEVPTKRICAGCGAEIATGMKFCTSCGKPVETPESVASTQEEPAKCFCTNCGAALEADVAFCTECGAKV